jgi:hypothetical protein
MFLGNQSLYSCFGLQEIRLVKNLTPLWVCPVMKRVWTRLMKRVRVSLVVEPIANLAAHPLVHHGGDKPRPPSLATGMEGNAAELHSEGSLASFKMNLLVLIMQLIVLSEYISSRTASARSDRPDKFVDLNGGIRHQMEQLNPKFVHNVCMY